MSTQLPVLTLNRGCREAIDWFIKQLNQADLQVMQTFDFQSARAAHEHCRCPHHGTEWCDCQIAVLLVYESGYPPASILAHGQDGRTWFSLMSSPHRTIDLHYEIRLQDTLAPFIALVKPDQWNYAA